MSVAVKVPHRPEIAQALNPPAGNRHIIDLDVAAALVSAQDVVVPCLLGRSAYNVLHGHVLDGHAVGRVAGWAAVEVILLDVDAVDGNVLQVEVLEPDVGDESGRVGV